MLSELIRTKPHITLFQESKIDSLSVSKTKSFLPRQADQVFSLPAVGTAGGTISAVNSASFQVVSFSHLTFSSTLILQSTACAHHIAITNIYAPSSRSLKLAFLDELASIAQPDDTPWLIAGDFNLIRFPSEKNNTAFRPAEANAFNQTLDNLALIELPLLDRRFTWSNNRASPTLEWLDRVFLTLHG